MKNQKISLELQDKDEERALMKLTGNLIQIINCKGPKKKIQFYHLSIQEFYAANYLLTIDDAKRKNLFQSENLKQFTVENLYHVFSLIRNKNEQIFQSIIRVSPFIRKLYEKDKNIKHLIRKGIPEKFFLKFLQLNDLTLTLLLQLGKDSKSINFEGVTFKFEHFIWELHENCKNIEETELKKCIFSVVNMEMEHYKKLRRLFSKKKLTCFKIDDNKINKSSKDCTSIDIFYSDKDSKIKMELERFNVHSENKTKNDNQEISDCKKFSKSTVPFIAIYRYFLNYWGYIKFMELSNSKEENALFLDVQKSFDCFKNISQYFSKLVCSIEIRKNNCLTKKDNYLTFKNFQITFCESNNNMSLSKSILNTFNILKQSSLYLNHLAISNCQFTEKLRVKLQETLNICDSLKKIYIINCKNLNDIKFNHKKLTEIDLHDSGFSGKVNDLFKLGSIKNINISNNKNLTITFEELTFKNISLNSINISNCNLSEEDIKALGKCLDKCQNIETLILNDIEYLNKVFNFILEGLIPSAMELKWLEMVNCNLDKKNLNDLTKFLEKCTNLNHINITENYRIGKFFSQIKKTFLTSKKNSNAIFLSDIDMDEIYLYFEREEMNSNNLNSLNISSNIALKNNLEKMFILFNVSKNITHLDLNSCYLTVSDGEILSSYIKRANYIKHINIGNNSSLGKSILHIISYLTYSKTNLISVNFENCSLNENTHGSALQKLFTDCCKIEYLDLSDNNEIFSETFIVFHGIYNLRNRFDELYLKNCQSREQYCGNFEKMLTKYLKIVHFAENQRSEKIFPYLSKAVPNSLFRLKIVNFDELQPFLSNNLLS